MTELAFTDGFYQADSLESMNMVCQNLYPKFVNLGDQVLPRLQTTPGLDVYTFPGTLEDGNRGMHALDGVPYAVNGGRLYRIDSRISVTNLGAIAGTGQVSIADNGTQMMILVPGGNGYIYDQDLGTLTQITDPDFTANGNPQYVIFIDGYFMCSTDSKKFIISALNDGLVWNALDFGSAEADPDPIVGLVNFKNEAYIFGSQTCEAFQNIGGAGFPFQRNGLILNKGLSAPQAILQLADTILWIGSGDNEEEAVYALQGTSTVKISNTAVDLLLRNVTATEFLDVSGFAYFQDGSYFACWTLPTVTICYDLETQKWHTRVSRDINNSNNFTAWAAVNLIETDQGILCGDLNGSFVGIVSRDNFREYSVDIVRIHDARPIRIDQLPFVCPQIELNIESGVGTNNDPDPLVRLKMSRDGAAFGDERQRSMGATGQRRKRIKWRRNGRFTDYAQFRFIMTDPVAYTVIGVHANFGVGRG